MTKKDTPPAPPTFTPRRVRQIILAVILVGLAVSLSNTLGFTDTVKAKVESTFSDTVDNVKQLRPTTTPTRSTFTLYTKE